MRKGCFVSLRMSEGSGARVRRAWHRPFSSLLLATGLAAIVSTSAGAADQQTLKPVLNAGEKTLRFDWPMLRVGTGEYEEGPTGVTVVSFGRKVYSAIDVRGGGPGTVNSDYMRLGYNYPELDAIVFAGGSWYGLEGATAVASALKDDGIRDGDAFSDTPNIAMSVGSIIFDFGPRRLNEIYPDKRLAQAAFRAARPGVFPLGAQGAGRFAKTGSFFGCNAYSGQGAAFRQIGEVKIAAFVVVNALGAVTKRDGSLAACYGDKSWPKDLHIADLMNGYPDSAKAGWTGPSEEKPSPKNTTISLIVTNQKLDPAELQRLAVQVHTSMARALQPFATQFDGDVLYAVSTAEFEPKNAEEGLPPVGLGVVGAEVMWDAILSSVPEQPVAPAPLANASIDASLLRGYAGDYVFSPFVGLRVTSKGGKLFAVANGKRPAYAIGKDKPVELLPVSENEFVVPGRYPLVLKFDGPDRLLVNPGHWVQTGLRQAK